MARAFRLAAAVAVAAVLVGVPLIGDWCAINCQAAQAQAEAHGMPACHHGHSAVSHVDQVPTSCGHDHSSILPATVAAWLTSPSGGESFAVTAGVDTASLRFIAATDEHSDVPSGAFSPPLSLALASALRI